MLFLIAVALLIALALWWHLGGTRKRSRRAKVRDPKRTADNFRCVEVRFSDNACDAVKRIGEKRFLSGEAPEIPVPGCDAATCACQYVHHKDRRHNDRRNPFPMRAAGPPASAGGDRRTKRDRRRSPNSRSERRKW